MSNEKWIWIVPDKTRIMMSPVSLACKLRNNGFGNLDKALELATNIVDEAQVVMKQAMKLAEEDTNA